MKCNERIRSVTIESKPTMNREKIGNLSNTKPHIYISMYEIHLSTVKMLIGCKSRKKMCSISKV